MNAAEYIVQLWFWNYFGVGTRCILAHIVAAYRAAGPTCPSLLSATEVAGAPAAQLDAAVPWSGCHFPHMHANSGFQAWQVASRSPGDEPVELDSDAVTGSNSGPVPELQCPGFNSPGAVPQRCRHGAMIPTGSLTVRSRPAGRRADSSRTYDFQVAPPQRRVCVTGG